MTPTFHGYYASPGPEQPDFFDRTIALQGIKAIAKGMPGVKVRELVEAGYVPA